MKGLPRPEPDTPKSKKAALMGRPFGVSPACRFDLLSL